MCLHCWDVSLAEAREIQRELAGRVIRERRMGRVSTVAGADVDFGNGAGQAAVVVLSYPALELVEYAIATRPINKPYIPGLLSFREGPLILDALEKLATEPDLLILDGHGIAHPRRLGIASHIGVLLDLPTIGCAKSRLCGQYRREPDVKRGSHVPLIEYGETIGAVVRTRRGVKPLFVSIGHRVDLPTCIDYVLNCCRGYRLPETTRWAHRLAGGTAPTIAKQKLRD